MNRNADIGAQKAQQIKYAKRAGIGLGVNMLGTGGVLGAKVYKNKLYGNFLKAHDAFYKNQDRRVQIKAKHPEFTPLVNLERDTLATHYQKAADNLLTKGNTANKIKKAAAVVNFAGAAYGGYAGARSLAAKYRQTPEGHAKAVAKRDEFKREMGKAFAKAKNIKPKPKKSLVQRFKNRKYFTNNDFKQAFKAAGLGMVMGPAGANAYLTSKKIANEIPPNNNRHGKKRRR